MAADLLDILTPAEAAQAIKYPDIVGDPLAELEIMVTGISRDIDRLCGPVVQRSVTDRLTATYGHTALQLKYWPVVSVTSVTEYQSGVATGQVLTLDDEDSFAVYGYLLDTETGTLYRRSNGFAVEWAYGDRNIVAVYVAGRHATTATVDRRFKMVASTILRRRWQEEAGRWAQRPPEFSEGDEGFVGFSSTDALIRQLLPGDIPFPASA